MQKITRKWRKSPEESHFDKDDKFSLPTRNENLPIDSQEQEELVRSLENLQTQQSVLWRGVFSGLLSCYVAFLVYSVYQQAYYPWELGIKHVAGDKYTKWILSDIMLTSCMKLTLRPSLLQVPLSQKEIFHSLIVGIHWKLSDWAAILTCLMTIKGLLHESKHQRRWLWSSCCIVMIVAVVWLHHMLRLAKFRWDVVWQPLVELECAFT